MRRWLNLARREHGRARSWRSGPDEGAMAAFMQTTAMNGGGHRGRGPTARLERRHDELTATLVEVALIYRQVFGPAASLQYAVLAHIKVEVAERVFQGRCRRRVEF